MAMCGKMAMKSNMPDILDRTIMAMSINDVEAIDIRDMLKSEGLTDYQAWLTYKGAKMILESQSEE